MRCVFTLLLLVSINSPFHADEPQVVKSVDLGRYTGLWHEIARIPNRFQKQCAKGTTAQYTLLEDGQIRVVNSCYREDGTRDSVAGLARVLDRGSSAKLQVSFVRFLGRQWFWGDYWIIGLDENYKWAVVGHPKRKYGWILSRTPEIPDSLRKTINYLLNEQGYNPDFFLDTLPNKEPIRGGP